MRQPKPGSPERFKTHRGCGSTNTEQIGMADNEFGVVYVGWCYDCLKSFAYLLRVEIVRDQRGRI